MKKTMMTLVAALAMTTATMTATAAPRDAKNNKRAEVTALNMDQNYDMRVNYRALASTLGLNDYQQEVLEMVHGRFVRDMRKAEAADDAKRGEMVRKAANTELKNMSYVLDAKQYRKFNMLLNATLSNRGLLK